MHPCHIYTLSILCVSAGGDVWKLLFATPNWQPGTEGCGFYCRCSHVTWHHPPLLYNIGKDPYEQHLCNASNISPPCPNLEEQQQIVSLMEGAVQRHLKSVGHDITNQFEWFRMIPLPWLQPCCNFPFCQCMEDGKE